MPETQVDVNGGDNGSRVSVQNEAGQRKHEPGRQSPLHHHLKGRSTVANGSADSGRKRLIVNFVG